VTTKNDVRVVKTACNMCLMQCGIDVYVENGKIVRVSPIKEHPYNKLCVKAYAVPELAHSSERLTNPLRKINGRFREVSWDEAFEFTAAKLTDIKEKYGPHSVIVHVGEPFVLTHTESIIRRFSELYGTTNYTTAASYCYIARIMAQMLTWGAHVSTHYLPATKCLVLWGFNPTESHPVWAHTINAMTRKETKLIVIDPRATPLAKKADIHARIRPGTDCALALGMLNVIIAEGLFDKAFVEQWTVGFDKLVEHVKEYSPKRVEEITWVKAETIRNMARMYATYKPAAIAHGVSLDHSTNGIQALRAVSVLVAITGNLDIPGGNIYGGRFSPTSFRLAEKVAGKLSIGANYPLFSQYIHHETVMPAIDAMLTEKPYPVKGLLLVGCNPALTWPNSNKVRQGFSQLDLLLVVDIFMTETAKMANIVLPGTTFLEREDIRDYGYTLSFIMLTNKVMEPVGNSMEDWKIWAELGKRMGYAEYFPWKDSDELFSYWLKPTNISLDQLRQNPAGIYYAEEKEFQKYLKSGFNTPSKKVEIYSQLMKDYGYDPLPTFHEPAESQVSRPDLVDKYPLIFVSGVRKIPYLHSEHRNLPSLRRLLPEPLIEVNPETASSLGIAGGNLVKVESPRGSIKLKAKLNKDIHPKIVVMQHGWNEANANALTDDMARDPVSGYPGFRSVLCKVTKAGQ